MTHEETAHDEAIRSGASERYLLGEMSADERESFEEHFFGCPECAEAVKATSLFREAATAHLREATESPALGHAAGGAKGSASERRRTGWGELFWPIPLGAAAALVAALGLAGYQGLVALPRAREAAAIQPASTYFLSVARSEAPTLRVAAGRRVAVLTLSRSSARSFPYYRCELRPETGEAVMRSVLPGPPEGEELQLLVPVGDLEPGAYALSVAGLETPTAASSASEPVLYHFTLERGPSPEPSR